MIYDDKEMSACFIETKVEKHSNNMIFDPNIILHKCLVFNGLAPMLSFGLAMIYMTAIGEGERHAWLIRASICIVLILFYLKFIKGISKVLNLMSNLYMANEQQFSGEDAKTYLSKLSKYGSASANLYLEILEKNGPNFSSSSMKVAGMLHQLSHSISATVIIISSACISVSYLTQKMLTSSSMNASIYILEFAFIFSCAILDVFSLMWLQVSIEKITKSLYLGAQFCFVARD